MKSSEDEVSAPRQEGYENLKACFTSGRSNMARERNATCEDAKDANACRPAVGNMKRLNLEIYVHTVFYELPPLLDG